MELFGLVDCNNFFVSCERLFRPDLWERPVVVLSSNDGVVVSRSQEAKALGVPMGVPYFKVKDLLAENKVAVFSSNFELYRDVSERVMSTLQEELDQVYQYSVDEAFFRFSAEPHEAVDAMLKIKAAVVRRVGVPVSLGAGLTMTIAKYASEKEKRGIGACLLVGEDWLQVRKEVPLGEIWGIGGTTARKMQEHGLKSVQDLCQADQNRIEKLFGVHGLRLRSELLEVPAHDPNEHSGLQKSIMSTRSFTKPLTKLSALEEAIAYHVERAAEELRQISGRCSSLVVIARTARHGDWFLRGGSHEVILSAPTNDTRVLLKAALESARAIYEEGVPYKKAGVVLGQIVPEGLEQFDLFSSSALQEKGSGLMTVLDYLNQKLGRDVLTIGRVKGTENRLTSRKFSSPRYTTSWNDLAKVKTKTKS